MSIHPRFALSGFAIAAVLFAGGAQADTALVAVAANYAGAIGAIAKEFKADTGNDLQITTGATGKLYAQIGEGAPFDILLSADAKTPEKLEEGGKAVKGSRFTYAIGQLALWSADKGVVTDDAKAVLTSDKVLHIAVANPRLAPYGLAAEQTIAKLGLTEALAPKIVTGENIGQTFSMVGSGAATVGFVAASAVLVPGTEPKGSWWIVPQQYFDPIRQDAVLLTHGSDNGAAKAFVDYLKGDKAKKIAASYGYATE